MAVISLSTISQIFKLIQPLGFEAGVIDVSPSLGLVQKKTDFYGTAKQLDWMVDRGGSASASFPTAQSNAGVPVHRKPQITRAKLYCVRQIDRESLLAAKKDQGALVELFQHAMETAQQELRYRAGSLLMGDGSGAIGQISAGSNVATATITLADPTQIINFRVGGTYAAFATVVGGLRSAGSVVTITAMNEDTGTLTVGTTWSGQIGAVAASDYLVPAGDFNAVAAGMFGWNPSTAPTNGENWFGVDRSFSIQAMSGCRHAPGSGSVMEILHDAMAKHAQQGGRHDTVLLNPLEWGSLEKEATNWTRITKNAIGSNGKEIASIGFEGLVMNSPIGKVAVMSDPFMPRYKGKLTRMASWELWSLENPFDLIKEGMGEGGAIPLATADGIELRLGGYWNYVLRRPRDSMDLTFYAQ